MVCAVSPRCDCVMIGSDLIPVTVLPPPPNPPSSISRHKRATTDDDRGDPPPTKKPKRAETQPRVGGRFASSRSAPAPVTASHYTKELSDELLKIATKPLSAYGHQSFDVAKAEETAEQKARAVRAALKNEFGGEVLYQKFAVAIAENIAARAMSEHTGLSRSVFVSIQELASRRGCEADAEALKQDTLLVEIAAELKAAYEADGCGTTFTYDFATKDDTGEPGIVLSWSSPTK